MTTNIAINGFGRIGRLVARALLENPREGLALKAINTPSSAEASAHLFKYDSVHGPFPAEVSAPGEDTLVVGETTIDYSQERDPTQLGWDKRGIDIVLECSGRFNSADGAAQHLTAGAKKVLISAPAKGDVDNTVVYGVNHNTLTADHKVVSNASCTTNCLAPVAKVLNDSIGIEKGLMTTIHAYTNDQHTLDASHKDLRRARAAAMSVIPTSTGAAKAVGLVLPELKGKLDGLAVRVPTPNVSLVDLSFTAVKATTVEEINTIMDAAAGGAMRDVIEVNHGPLVSVDFNHNMASAVFDATQTRVSDDGKLVKILAWYDNEWGFSQRMIDVAKVMASL